MSAIECDRKQPDQASTQQIGRGFVAGDADEYRGENDLVETQARVRGDEAQEAAAGLAPGSGALYHHFKSKQALLEAGIDRQLDRRRAMRDIRALFAGLGDLRSELTMLGRYVLTVLGEESQLLQIACRTPSDRSPRLTDAYAALFDASADRTPRPWPQSR